MRAGAGSRSTSDPSRRPFRGGARRVREAPRTKGAAMIDFSRNHFELFGLEPRYRLDPARLDERFRALQADVHPDRFGTADETARRLAHQSSARVNEAYRTLKDPVERARYLLSLRGVDAMDEKDTSLALD